ncbi:hypothetical protein FBY22_3985 [Streptomyces sp. SLBN-31]|nr:hypothetical protein FBY22_3985 [Streptomyces sp. SLBN-31]
MGLNHRARRGSPATNPQASASRATGWRAITASIDHAGLVVLPCAVPRTVGPAGRGGASAQPSPARLVLWPPSLTGLFYWVFGDALRAKSAPPLPSRPPSHSPPPSLPPSLPCDDQRGSSTSRTGRTPRPLPARDFSSTGDGTHNTPADHPSRAPPGTSGGATHARGAARRTARRRRRVCLYDPAPATPSWRTPASARSTARPPAVAKQRSDASANAMNSGPSDSEKPCQQCRKRPGPQHEEPRARPASGTHSSRPRPETAPTASSRSRSSPCWPPRKRPDRPFPTGQTSSLCAELLDRARR